MTTTAWLLGLLAGRDAGWADHVPAIKSPPPPLRRQGLQQCCDSRPACVRTCWGGQRPWPACTGPACEEERRRGRPGACKGKETRARGWERRRDGWKACCVQQRVALCRGAAGEASAGLKEVENAKDVQCQEPCWKNQPISGERDERVPTKLHYMCCKKYWVIIIDMLVLEALHCQKQWLFWTAALAGS